MSDAAAAVATMPPPTHSRFWKGAGFSFHDLLDAINPLQHLPVISTIYRWATGDKPGNVAEVVGDGIYGGPIGFGVGLLMTMTKNRQGDDLSDRAMAWVFGHHGSSSAKTAIASAQKPASSAPAESIAAAPPSRTVAALYRAGAAVGEAKPMAQGKPIPLIRTAAAELAAPPVTDPAARAFLAQTAMMERHIAQGRGASLVPPAVANARPIPVSRPIPLSLSGTPLSLVRASPLAGEPSVPAGAAPSAAAAPTEISRKMMDALDKYMRLQKQQEAADTTAADPVLLRP